MTQKRHIIIYILLALLLNQIAFANTTAASEFMPAESQQTSRPKIAVVLAGGGAKGIAHVPVLKAIEDAGLPVDMVVGTSIGSIVGGMYCTGYSPDTMRQIIRNTDWIKLITDNPGFDNRTLTGKKDNENYLLRFTIDSKRLRSQTGFGGVIAGNNVLRFFQDLTYTLPDSLDFDDMPIPFACVGTKAVNGECKVFNSGNLPLAMRASMAIPTVFTPVTIDSVVYVDGGVVDNFPVDIARQMGADIVIGVDLKVKTDEAEMTNSAIDLLMHCVDLYSQQRYEQNVKDADIYIPIDVTGYSAASFGAQALDTLMARGEYYVSLKRHELDSLSHELNLQEPPHRIRIGDYTFANASSKFRNWQRRKETETTRSLEKANDGSHKSAINIGGRFDNQEFASIMLKVNGVLSKQYATLLITEARLGERFDISSDFSTKSFANQRVGFKYRFQRHSMGYRQNGKKCADFDMFSNNFNLYAKQEWHSVQYTFGVNYTHNIYEDLLTGNTASSSYFNDAGGHLTENFFSYFLKSEFNSLDRQYLPQRGQKVEVYADILTDNLYQYEGTSPIPVVSLDWMGAIALSDKFNLQPHLYARTIWNNGRKTPIAMKNVMGGLFKGMHFAHQATMAGVSRMEMIDTNALGIFGLTTQYNVYRNHFALLTADVCTHTDSFEDILSSNSLNWGIRASYSVRTPIGPLSLDLHWSDLTKKAALTINAGYYF